MLNSLEKGEQEIMGELNIKFLSLFVHNINEARIIYTNIFGPPDTSAGPVQDFVKHHPFAGPAAPVVFQSGSLKLVLYQADGRITHPGDTGIGLVLDSSGEEFLQRVRQNKGRVFFDQNRLMGQDQRLAVFILPDRHFFEVLTQPPERPKTPSP